MEVVNFLMSNKIQFHLFTAIELLHKASDILKVLGQHYGESSVREAKEQVENALISLNKIQTDAVARFRKDINIENDNIDWDNLNKNNSPDLLIKNLESWLKGLLQKVKKVS